MQEHDNMPNMGVVDYFTRNVNDLAHTINNLLLTRPIISRRDYAESRQFECTLPAAENLILQSKIERTMC